MGISTPLLRCPSGSPPWIQREAHDWFMEPMVSRSETGSGGEGVNVGE